MPRCNKGKRNISAVSDHASTGMEVEVGAKRAPFSILNNEGRVEEKNVASEISRTRSGRSYKQVLMGMENEEVAPPNAGHDSTASKTRSRRSYKQVLLTGMKYKEPNPPKNNPSGDFQTSKYLKPDREEQAYGNKKTNKNKKKQRSKGSNGNRSAFSRTKGVGSNPILDEFPSVNVARCCSELCYLPGENDFNYMLNVEFRDESSRRCAINDQLKSMVAACKRDVKDPEFPLTTYTKLHGGKISQLFAWSGYLRVNEEAYFRAMELYCRFCATAESEDIQETFNFLYGKDKVAEMEKQGIAISYEALCEAHKEDIVVICVCIGMSSKLHAASSKATSEYESLCVFDLSRELSTVDRYDEKDLFEVERRVWKILNFKLSWVTPFDMATSLVATLSLSGIQLTHVYRVTLLYLQYSYVQNADLYTQVSEIYRSEWLPAEEKVDPIKHELNFKRTIEYNIPLRAAAVVCGAVSHISSEFQASTIHQFSQLLSLPEIQISTVTHLLQRLVADYPNKIEILDRPIWTS